jgi:hypothetical protein
MLLSTVVLLFIMVLCGFQVLFVMNLGLRIADLISLGSLSGL